MKRIALGIAALVVAVIIAVVVYFAFIRGEADEAFSLSDGTEQSGDTEQSDSTEQSDDTDAEPADGADTTGGDADAGSAADGLDGTWTVTTGSQAGYRVVEDLGSVLDFEATGRTSDVTGSIVVSGTSITEGSFEVQIATIVSDDDKRDGQFVGPIMSAAEFPTATLTLTDPIELGSVPAENTPVSTMATGELTLRGATNAVTFPVDAQLTNGQVEIVAAVDVLFSDYGIGNPTNPFVTVRDEGKVEVQLFLAKS